LLSVEKVKIVFIKTELKKPTDFTGGLVLHFEILF